MPYPLQLLNGLFDNTKTTATIVSAGAKTIVDCGLAAANEIMRDAAQFSLNELKQRKEVKQMAYSFNKLMNKNQAKKSNNRANNFSLQFCASCEFGR